MHKSFLAATVIFSLFCNTIFISPYRNNAFGYLCQDKTGTQIINSGDSIGVADTVCLKGMPPIGKWMFQANKQRADWLGVQWENKTLIEPINIILIDSISQSAEQSEKLLIENLKKAGYKSRGLHSGGYMGYIGNAYYTQYPKEKNHAFSNASAFTDNNHCRIFGAHYFKGAYYYTASLSRENVAPFSKIKHHFASFVRARDEFASHLNKKSKFKLIKSVVLYNTICNNSSASTGDHDGIALVLSLKK
jgi:hypothetical protein